MHSRLPRLAWVLVALTFGVHAQISTVESAEVSPLRTESTAGPCRFELTIPRPEAATRAVWVIYDRGRETKDFYNDSDLFHFAESNRLALLWARHCPANNNQGEIDPNPARGLGRALFASLDQLATASKHGEFSSSKVIVFGFGLDGVLAARMPTFAPDRVLASIVYAPAAEVHTVVLESAPAGIPQLIIANGADTAESIAGAREYFSKNFVNGAPWALAVQNGVPKYGGLENIKPILFPWLQSIIETVPDITGPAVIRNNQRSGFWLYVSTDENGSAVKDAKTEKVGADAPRGFLAAGWVPTKKAAKEWQRFERKSSHPVNSKYP